MFLYARVYANYVQLCFNAKKNTENTEYYVSCSLAKHPVKKIKLNSSRSTRKHTCYFTISYGRYSKVGPG